MCQLARLWHVARASCPLGPGASRPAPRHGRDGHATGNVAQGPLSGPAALLACGGPGRDARGNSDGRKPSPRSKFRWKTRKAGESLALLFRVRPRPPAPAHPHSTESVIGRIESEDHGGRALLGPTQRIVPMRIKRRQSETLSPSRSPRASTRRKSFHTPSSPMLFRSKDKSC